MEGLAVEGGRGSSAVGAVDCCSVAAHDGCCVWYYTPNREVQVRLGIGVLFRILCFLKGCEIPKEIAKGQSGSNRGGAEESEQVGGGKKKFVTAWLEM